MKASGGSAASVRIELLGSPRLVLPTGDTHVLERRDAALLAWLAWHGPTPRSRLVALLWPDVSTRTAQTNLRQRLFRLRQRTGNEIVVSDRVMALADGVHHDLDVEATEIGGPHSGGARPLLGALDYDHCGELGDWVTRARERWQGDRLQRLARQAARLEEEGRIADAMVFADLLTGEAPTAEHAHRRVMRLHYRRGDRAAALSAYARCQDALERELGTRPGDETRELAALIERSGVLPAPVATPRPVATLRPPRLIGREREWRALGEAWQHRQPVLLLGEPGIGKSRLAADFATAQGTPQIHRAQLGDARVAYSLLARLLRGLRECYSLPPDAWVVTELARLLPELGPTPAGKLEPLRLRRAVATTIAHWHEEGLGSLVIDDLHFADQPSLEWLLAWLTEPGGVQLLMTVRSNEVPPTLAACLRAHEEHGVVELAVLPLATQDVAELIDSLGIPGLEGASLSEGLTRHTGGNPLFILETLKVGLPNALALASGTAAGFTAPAHIGKLLDRRLEQLSPAALRLARVAALAGSDFSAGLAARVLGAHVLDLADAWAELERTQILLNGGFAHDLILDATQRSVPEAIRVALHHALAEALENDGAPPARIAHHWHLAREWARAAVPMERAARVAHTAARPREALAWWDQCATCHEKAGARAAAFQARVNAIDSAIAVETADQVAARVDGLMAHCRTDPERLRALLARVRQLTLVHRFESALPFSEEGLALARRVGDRPHEFRLASLQAIALAMTGRLAESLAVFDAMAGALDEAENDEVRSEFCSDHGYVLHANGRFRDAVPWFERAAALSEAAGDPNGLVVNLGNLSTCLGHLGRHEQALATALRAQAVQARSGELKGDPYAISLLNLGMFYSAAGRIGEALAAYQQALDLSRRGNSHVLAASVEHHLANNYLALGQPARAHQVLTALPAEATVMVRARRAAIEWRIAAQGGPQGPERLRQALEELGPTATAIDRLALELNLAAALPADESRAHNERIRQEALASGQPTVALTALIRLADAERRTGRHAQAAASARTAVAEAATSGRHDMFAPAFWWLAFQSLDAGGCEAEALAALRTGVDWIRHALPHVPEAFRDSYLHRSQDVPQLLAAAKQRLA